MLFACTAVWAGQDRAITFDQLPKPAQQFVKKHFVNQSIGLVKKETDLFAKSYEVIFTNGDKIEFYGSGEWKEVDCRYSELPQAIVPVPIKSYISRTYPQSPAHKIEKLRRGRYEVKLTNGMELTFDKTGQVVEIDL